jgi:hypothetical protein
MEDASHPVRYCPRPMSQTGRPESVRSSLQRQFYDSSPNRSDTASRFRARDVVALTATAIAGFLWFGRDLPRVPWPTPDTESYLQFSPIRPHGYSWLLAGYRLVFEDFAYLPHIKLGLLIVALLLLAIAVAKRLQSVAPAMVMLVLIFAGLDAADFADMMSDYIYAAALTAGIACFLLYEDAPRAGLLLSASALLGLAATFRVVGIYVLSAFFLAVLAICVGRGQKAIPALALAALPVGVVLCAAASSQLAINGHLAFGSWGGMDVLGKLPLLSRPAPKSSEFARLNGFVEMMGPAREKLAQLKPLTQALVARQYYEYLRWRVIRPELERNWSDWRDSDEYERGRLATELAKTYIIQDPVGFFRRSAIELAGLWAMPRWLTPAEHAAAVSELENVGELPLLTAFSRMPEGQYDFYKIIPDPTDLTKIALFRSAAIAFWAFSLALIGLMLVRPLSTMRLAPDLILIAMAVHAVYVTTALMEGVHERYISATWPMLVAGPILALGLVRRFRKQSC